MVNAGRWALVWAIGAAALAVLAVGATVVSLFALGMSDERRREFALELVRTLLAPLTRRPEPASAPQVPVPGQTSMPARALAPSPDAPVVGQSVPARPRPGPTLSSR